MKTNLSQTCLLAVVLLALPAATQAQFNYTTSNGAITITGYTGPGAVNIPATINGLPVRSIGDSAFSSDYNRTNLTSVTIPNSVNIIGNFAFDNCHSVTNVTIGNSVMGIGEWAFADCNLLTNVTIPNGVTSIGTEAFGFCSGLSSVTIGNGVTSIGVGAFSECISLTNVTIPSSVTNIGDSAFSSCTSLTAITVDAQNSFYSSVNGVLFDKSQTTLVEFPEGIGGSYTIPVSVMSIGNQAFYWCANLTSVTIGNRVTSIGSAAFQSCSSLTNAIIGNGVTSIGDYAFADCGLTSVIIPGSVTSIGEGAFMDCTSLTEATIAAGVSSIGDDAFFNCSGLTNVTIPGSVTSIGISAFNRCSELTSVIVPGSVTNIGEYAFFDCTSLTAITVGVQNLFYSSVNGVLFDKSQTTLIQYPASTAGNYTIPSSVGRIECDAFASCFGLTSVTIPGSVTDIGFGAFKGCSGLISVYFMGDAPSIIGDFYDGPVFASDNDMTVYYLPGTTGWDDFTANTGGNTGVQALLWNPFIQTGDGNFGVRTNQFGFNINWASGQTVVVEACSDLANPLWSPVATNTLTSDSSYFSDPHWTNFPSRFYRLRSP